MAIHLPTPEVPALAGAPGSGERLRLGTLCARRFGLIFTISAAVNLALPEHDRLATFAPALVGLGLMALGFLLLTPRTGRVVAALTYCVALATLGTFLLPGSAVDDNATLASVTALASAAIPSLLVAMAVAEFRSLLPLVLIAGLPVLVLSVAATAQSGRAAFVVLAILGGWAALLGAGLWLARSARQAAIGQERLRDSYAAERRSTEAEAELRYGARMMHDTVLATLTLVAHSGRGVPPATLRAQAAADSALLEQLRTEGTLPAHRDAADEVADTEPAAGTTTHAEAPADEAAADDATTAAMAFGLPTGAVAGESVFGSASGLGRREAPSGESAGRKTGARGSRRRARSRLQAGAGSGVEPSPETTSGFVVDGSAVLEGPSTSSRPGADPWAAVRAWSAAQGLDVNWHGADAFPAAQEQRASLVEAVVACLEIVRLHSGVLVADVTVSGDAVVQRAVVTDAGRGFASAPAPAETVSATAASGSTAASRSTGASSSSTRAGSSTGARSSTDAGLSTGAGSSTDAGSSAGSVPEAPGTEAAVGRVAAAVRERGGSLRVFSSPGRGTTVLIEVPR